MRRAILSLFLLVGAVDLALAQARDPAPMTDAEGIPLPAGAVARLGSTRFWHRDLIHSIRFSPDGRLLFTGTFNHEALYAWDAATGRRRWQVALGDPQRNSATFGRALDPCDLGFQGNHVVIILPDERKQESIVRLDLATGKEVAWVPLVPPVTVEEYRFSRNGARVAISHEKRLAVYDTASGRQIFTQELAYEVNRREGMDFSPDGGMLAVGDYDGVVHFLRSDNGRTIRDVLIGKGPAMGVRFAEDGKRVVVRAMTSAWKPIVVLDATTGAVRHRLQAKGQSWHVWSSALGPKGNELATCCRVYPEGGGLEDVVVFWDLATGKELRRFPVTVPYYMAIRPDGRVLATGGVLSVELFDLTTGKPLPQSADPVGGYEQFRQRPDGRWVCLSPGSVDTFDGAGRKLSRFTPEDGPDGGAWSGYLSPDGTRVARCRGAIQGEVCGPVEIWDPAAGRLLVSFGRTTSREPVPRRRRESYSILGFSPDGKALFTSRGESDSLQAWDTTTGKPLRPPRGLSVRDWQAPLSPDGRWLAVIRPADSCNDLATPPMEVRLVNTATGRPAATLKDIRPARFQVLAFSPDSRLLAVAPDHETDMINGRRPISPDLVYLFEVPSGRERGRLRGPSGCVRNAAFSSDSKTVAAVGLDGIVRLWEVATTGERHTVSCAMFAYPLTFSRDSKVLATIGVDAPVSLWDVYGRRTRAKPDAATLDRAWTALASPNAVTGFDGVRALIAAPTETVRLLRSRLPVAIGPDAATLRQWLTDLDSPTFATRDRATKELTAVAGQMEPVLRKALAAAPSLEVQRRLETILAHAGEPTPAVLRILRAVEVLEVIGTPESKRLLTDLAGGSANQRLTIEAKAAVGRQK